jgi:hypothetical protein
MSVGSEISARKIPGGVMGGVGGLGLGVRC